MLFISHANPSDNEFSRWLALRLAAEGYRVWCDLTQLLGGERFWTDIEAAIRTHTTRFLFVLSRSSNQKTGPLDELNLALATQRANELSGFVIPLWIDDLPSLEFNVRLGGINAIPFMGSWATGLAQLLGALERGKVPRDSHFGPQAVGAWWADNVGASQGLTPNNELLVSNVYPVRDTSLYVYKPAADWDATVKPNQTIPSVFARGLLASFVPPVSVSELGPGFELWKTLTVDSEGLPSPPQGWRHSDMRRAMTRLLNEHWRLHLDRSGLSQYTFSGGRPSAFFTLADKGLDRVTFSKPLEPDKKSARQLMGYKTLSGQVEESSRRRYWHFALEARANYDLGVGFVMKPHVLFSDDGNNVWEDDNQLHRARRSQCKNWWNDKWRDLIQAGVTAIAGTGDSLDLSLGPGATLQMSTAPIITLSPVSYEELAHAPLEDLNIEGDDLIEGGNEEDD